MGSFGTPFLSLPILLRWPDDLVRAENKFQGFDQIAAWWRCDEYRKAELALLPLLARDEGDVNSSVSFISLRGVNTKIYAASRFAKYFVESFSKS